jgi:Peptidase family M41
MNSRAKRGRPTSTGLADPRLWVVYSHDDQILGEVEADELEAARAAAAAAGWPDSPRLRVCHKRSVEKLTRQNQAKIERDPGPIAYHEAGHAVLGILMDRRRLIRVEVRARFLATNDTLGRVEWAPDRASFDHFGKRNREVIEARIMVVMAGPIAESVHRGRKRLLPLRESDLRAATQLGLFQCGGIGLCVTGKDNIILQRYLEWLTERSRFAVRELWDQIDHVAKALIERRELSGRDVKLLLAEVTERVGN